MQNSARVIQQDLSHLGQGLEQGVIRVEQSIISPVEQVLSWKPVELFTYLAMVALFVYVVYILITVEKDRSTTNLLLLFIAINIIIQIQQNINVKATLPIF